MAGLRGNRGTAALDYLETPSGQSLALAHLANAERLQGAQDVEVNSAAIGDRILARYFEAADTILMDGSNSWEVDEAMVEFGCSIGPYEMQDISGLDIAQANRRRQAVTRDPNHRHIPILDRMVAEGRLGRKSGVGWYRYPGGQGPVIDPLIEDLIREEAYFAKVTRRDFTPAEIIQRLVLAMINEAADIMKEGIARSAADINLISVSDLGFPRGRGGLMYYADQIGVQRILADLSKLCTEDPLVWKPSALLLECQKTNTRISEHRQSR